MEVSVFRDTEAFSGFPVDDIERARRFYGDALGLKTSLVYEPMSILTLHIAGGRGIAIYEKQDHIPASFTVLDFPVKDIERIADDLGGFGLCFES